MKINAINRPHVDPPSKAQRAAKSGTTSSDTKVAVSNEARHLAEARAPEVSDASKIQRLADAIARGQFKLDAERLIDRMIADEM
jgi:negative regulator of flagellin synthesis FlgM